MKCLTSSLEKITLRKIDYEEQTLVIVSEKIAFVISDWEKRFGKNNYWEN